MTVAQAKSSAGTFNLRFQGQAVADLKFKGDTVILDAAPYHSENKKYFGIELPDSTPVKWRSPEGTLFRTRFFECLARGKTPEHALESRFLSELEKNVKATKDRALCHIRPVKIASICRFQMPTPLKASTATVSYAGDRGGGIDILARAGIGGKTGLCIMELKQGKACNNPGAAMSQALAYAVFLQELLAGRSGRNWYSIFGYSAARPLNKPRLRVCIVMPYSESGKQSLDCPLLLDTVRGPLELHHIYLEKDWEQNLRVKSTSLFPKA